MTDTTRKKIQGVVHGLGQDLIVDAAVSRHLPPLPVDVPALAGLPARQRQVLRWSPHIVIGAFAVALFWLSWLPYYTDSYGHRSDVRQWSLLLGLLTAAPLVLVLFRPIAAWWLSLAGICTVAFSALRVDPFPFPQTVFASHLAVMVLVTLRSGPVVAAAMWVCTVTAGGVLTELIDLDPGSRPTSASSPPGPPPRSPARCSYGLAGCP
ncbi:hypothetical protein NKH77_00595 [Streptomyces sp. M19]